MNPELQVFLQDMVAALLASLPQLVIVLGYLFTFVKSIKGKVDSFPAKVDEFQKISNEKFDSLQVSVNDNIDKMQDFLFNNLPNQIQEQVKTAISSYLDPLVVLLENYSSQLQSTTEQVNILSRQNKVYLDIILKLVAQDPQKVKDGVAKYVTTLVNSTKQELERYPQLLIKELPKLQMALKEALVVMGQQEFQKLLVEIGYEAIEK
ncbi:MAG: hypothetical protein WCS93_07010 [Candidatus Delongbacteria bacterium]